MTRQVLVVVHAGREEARGAAQRSVSALLARGIGVQLLADEASELGLAEGNGLSIVDPADAARDCELTLVLGGDGTILRATELTRAQSVPMLGVNLGHVGFLAEAEQEDVESTIDAIAERAYTAEERLTLDVVASHGGQQLWRTFALNEASVEKAARERMLQVMVSIDNRPLSAWGCDGVVCATPTGSTAYNFSAGGPVVWPSVEALLMVPLSAHALFARPLVVAPTSVLTIEVLGRGGGSGVVWCDGRRSVELPEGARIDVRRDPRPVQFVRLHQAPFTDRLVAKFGLPVHGWRGVAEQRWQS